MGGPSHGCIGFVSLGLCNYDPAAPAITYFSVGEAVAALALTLAVQQFLKPSYELRLTARRLGLWHIYALCFAGAASAVTAAILPNLPIERSLLPAYPIFWELLGAFCFFFAYAALALGSTIPLRVRAGHVAEFARGIASFLSERDPKDYPSISHDILRNLPDLIRKAAFAENRLRGMSAFFEFTHRRALEDAGYAATLLRVMSDREFCRSLVEGSPWALARTLREISAAQLFTRSAEDFIQEVARQALLSEKSIMAREVGYRGFSHVPILTEALFSDSFIVRRYRPLYWVHTDRAAYLNESFLDRLGSASEKAFQATMEAQDYWHAHHLYDVKETYEQAFREIRRAAQKQEVDAGVTVTAYMGVTKIIEKVRENLLKNERMDDFYLREADNYLAEYDQYDYVGATAQLTAECLFAIANRFEGADDPFWSFALSVWRKVYPDHGNQPSGMDPLQQRLALLLLRTLDENLKGYYPTITRVFLAVIGPYRSHQHANPRSAAALLEMHSTPRSRAFGSWPPNIRIASVIICRTTSHTIQSRMF